MRTTLDVDEDVLHAVKELARLRRKTAGHVISELARRGIHASSERSKKSVVVGGFEVLPAEGRIVTPQLVDRLLEEGSEA
ncbi:MAG: hypothetical protein KDM81_21895 [Verrucomicrobiae bacterium]|nr:hypothetical protein [Verrucomicrobiae bacterium]MCP5520651.1 hypothetical protein [Verrucomicrobiales bacterium]